MKMRLTTNPRLLITLVALLTLAIGIVCGIILQKFRIPNYICLKCLYTYQTIMANIDNKASDGPLPEVITLKTRRFEPSLEREIYDTEKDSAYTYQQRLLELNKTALIIIDAWEYHPNDGWLERSQENMKLKLRPLLELARQHNVLIIHAPHGQEIAGIARPIQGEYTVQSNNPVDATIELDDYLKAHKVATLLYAGYTSNSCILYRPTGIIKMSDLGYDIILVRDCTIAFETPDSLNEEWVNKITISTIEHHWGETTTLEDLQVAFGKLQYEQSGE